MALTKSFYEAVKEGNVRRIRIMMKDSLLVDPSFKEFDEMNRVALSVGGLYDKHDGRMFELDETNWNDDYMSTQLVQLVNNFSHERVEHLKDVLRKLRPNVKTVKMDNSETTNTCSNVKDLNYQEQKHKDQVEGKYRGKKIAAGAIAGAVVGGVIASVAEGTVVGGLIIGAAIGGVAVTVVTNGGN